MIKTMSVAERIVSLQNIFNSFGIPVLPNSSLDLAIKAEFGAGKRSKLTPLLLELHQESDASKLATCIGSELKNGTADPQVLAVSKVLQERLPPILEIIDIRQSTEKREKLLAQLIDHFATKLPKSPQTERMLRMLAAAQQNLLVNTQVTAVGRVTESVGVACKVRDLQRFGNVLQGIIPALIAVDQPDYPAEQKINLCTFAFRVLAAELRSSKMQKCANILDSVHWLAKVSLPKFADQATIEQGLNQLGLSVGNMSTQLIYAKAKQSGLTQQEIIQIIYSAADPNKLATADRELLTHTQQNQQYAAVCGYVAKLAQDLQQDELKKIGIAGICLASLRQTYYELKTKNLQATNLSESLGTILVGAGSITENDTLSHIGNSVLSGVQTYAGIMAVPGGASIAVPLAVCSVLGKLFLDPPKSNSDQSTNDQRVLAHMVQEIVVLQQQMRSEFANVYQELYAAQHNVLSALDQGFEHIACISKHNNLQVLTNMRSFDQKLDCFQLQINQEFSDLYLEYVRKPLAKVAFATRYGVMDQSKMHKNKHELALWLVHRSKHPKITGGNLALENIPGLCSKLHHSDEALSLVNRYVNINFTQHLPEDLPHIPTWLLAAYAYVQASNTSETARTMANEEQLLSDIIAVGQQTVSFTKTLAENADLWRCLEQATQQTLNELKTRWLMLKTQFDESYLQSIDSMASAVESKSEWQAKSANAEQLEPFAPISVDISAVWSNQLQQHIPSELQAAVAQGLARWQINFTIEKSVNTFADVHIAYGDNMLPNHARDVLFKVELYFVPNQSEHAQLLTTTWLAYDLHDARRRFDQYYQQKFKYPLKHDRYHWISLDGLANHVEGHGNTPTQKLIDYERLANIYKNWLSQATPVNDPEVLARIKSNTVFKKQHNAMLESEECTVIQNDQIMLLRLQCYNELRAEMSKQRIAFAAMLYQDTALSNAFAKLEVYMSILAVYMRILNIPFQHTIYRCKFDELINLLQQTDALNSDLLVQFDELFNTAWTLPKPEKQYLTGDFYLKMQAAIVRLGLLQTNLAMEHLRLAVT